MIWGYHYFWKHPNDETSWFSTASDSWFLADWSQWCSFWEIEMVCLVLVVSIQTYNQCLVVARQKSTWIYLGITKNNLLENIHHLSHESWMSCFIMAHWCRQRRWQGVETRFPRLVVLYSRQPSPFSEAMKSTRWFQQPRACTWEVLGRKDFCQNSLKDTTKELPGWVSPSEFFNHHFF